MRTRHVAWLDDIGATEIRTWEIRFTTKDRTDKSTRGYTIRGLKRFQRVTNADLYTT